MVSATVLVLALVAPVDSTAAGAPASLHRWRPDAAPAGATIALCYTGQLRTLAYSWMLENVAAALLRPLQPAVFLRVSRQTNTVSMHARRRCAAAAGGSNAESLRERERACAEPGYTSQRELDAVLRALNPVGVALQDDTEVLRSFGLQKSAAPRAGCGGSSCGTLLLRMAGCASDVLALEAEPGRARFRWVIRSRPDLLWACRLPDASQWPVLWPMGRSSMMFRDFLAAYTRDVAMDGLRLARRVARGPGTCDKLRVEHTMCLDATLREGNATWCDLPSFRSPHSVA